MVAIDKISNIEKAKIFIYDRYLSISDFYKQISTSVSKEDVEPFKVGTNLKLHSLK